MVQFLERSFRRESMTPSHMNFAMQPSHRNPVILKFRYFVRRVMILIVALYFILEFLSFDNNSAFTNGDKRLRRGIATDYYDYEIMIEDESMIDDKIMSGDETNIVIVQDDEIDSNRPKMYTFFHRIDEDERSTGMSDQSDDTLIELWHKEWAKAGFDVEVLTMKHAKLHPRYKEFSDLLDYVPLNTPTKIYNLMCFYRHLAMAAVGGGYLSDYDVLPLPINYLDNQVDTHPGNLAFPFPRSDFVRDLTDDSDIIVYSATKWGGGIPCLMSGSPSKWEELAFAMVETGQDHKEVRLWTDMLAMMDLQDMGYYTVEDKVLKKDLFGKRWTGKECDKMNDMVAIHFSHYSLKDAGKNVDERPMVAKRWLNRWRRSCRNTSNESEK